jgi:GNAT superfamily N-acetyltransferase
MDAALRLHNALCGTFERLAEVLEDSRFERRDGYVFVTFPTVPLPSFNGVWGEPNSAPGDLEAAIGEIQDLGIPAGVLIRAGKMPAVRQAARGLGFTSEERIPGMAATETELRPPAVPELEVLHVATADGLAQSLAVAAIGFGVTADLLAPLYMLEVAALDGIEYYLGRVDGRDVSTALGFTIGGTVGIFNVATPPEHRGRGYGAAITAYAVREGFAAGADLAWLQSSRMGESVYQRLGFREVETYLLLTRPREVSGSS